MTGARELLVGESFGGYRIEALAGRGGMGLVYRARQSRPDRVVAIKVISPQYSDDPDFRRRFERESNMAAQIEHPNVLPVYEVGEEEGRLFIAMRFVEGTDLGALRRRLGRLTPPEAARIVAQVAGALDAAHERGLVHRDVKPSNLLLAGGQPSNHVYLTDFGVTKRQADSHAMTTTGAVIGTLDYIAPEQLQGRRIDGRADVYALGCVLYELLAGTVPFERDTDVAKMFAHVSDEALPLHQAAPGLSPTLSAVVAKAMVKEPADRYQSAGEFAAAVNAAVADTSSPAATTVRAESTPRAAAVATKASARASGKRPWMALGGLAAIALVAAIVVLVVSGGGSQQRSPEALVRALYAAVNRSDYGAVASLFAPVAMIDGQRYRGHQQIARAFGSLPCGADIVSLRTTGSTVTLRERLHDRPGSSCGSYTGTVDTATMTVHQGKLTSWTHG
jgi:serine/threonine-protein kinase